MSSTTIDTAMAEVTGAAETIRRSEVQRFPDAASPGDGLRQGDILVTLLAGKPAGLVKVDKPITQLAPGTTQGSRHCLDSLDGVTISRLERPGAYDGPVLELEKERTIEHPEHGHMVLPPGCYAVTFQRTVDSGQREARVLD